MAAFRRGLVPPPATSPAWRVGRAGEIITAEFFGSAASTAGYVNVWTGSAWALKPVKVWTGSAWVQKPVKFWTGSAWVAA